MKVPLHSHLNLMEGQQVLIYDAVVIIYSGTKNAFKYFELF